MTNTEAIKYLKQLKYDYNPLCPQREALRLAIRALEERPKGKWIFDQEENVLTQTGEFVATYHCSECGKKIKTVESYLSKNHCFCSVCGADMRGEEE